VGCDDLPYVLLDRFDEALHHAAQLMKQWSASPLAHSQALQNLLYQTRLEVTALITMYLPRYRETAEVDNQSFRHCRSLLAGNGVGFRPFGIIVKCGQEVSVSLVAPWEGPSYIDGYPFERSPDFVLMHLAPIPGLGAVTGCTVVALPAPHCLLLGASSTFAGLYSGSC
jgi:hypothetical protein